MAGVSYSTAVKADWDASISKYLGYLSYANVTLSPTINVIHSTVSAYVNDEIPISSLFSLSDPNGPGITRVFFSLSNGNGSVVSYGQSGSYNYGSVLGVTGFYMPTSELQNYFIKPLVSGASLPITFYATDELAISGPVNFTVSVVANTPPTTTTTRQIVAPGQSIQLSTLFSSSDAEGAVTQYELSQLTGTSTLNKNGVSIAVGSNPYDFSAADLGQYSITMPNSATVAGVAFSIKAYDGHAWGADAQASMITHANTGPEITSTGLTLHPGQDVTLTSLFNVADAQGDATTSFKVLGLTGAIDLTKDGMSLHTSVYYANMGQPFQINAQYLNQFHLQAGQDPAVPVTLSIQAFDGADWGATKVLSYALA